MVITQVFSCIAEVGCGTAPLIAQPSGELVIVYLLLEALEAWKAVCDRGRQRQRHLKDTLYICVVFYDGFGAIPAA